MGQLQKVSWRTVGYAALGTVVAAASVVAIINSDGVRPTSLTSSAATRWLFDQAQGTAVLVDGLAGRVVAKVDAETPGSTDVAVQGVGGAFLVAKAQGSVRTISTAKLSLGTAQPVPSLLNPDAIFGVGASGLTVVSGKTGTANVVAVDDVSRPVTVPKSEEQTYVAADGSMWLFSDVNAFHVNVDESTTTVRMRSAASQATTVGAHGIAFDNFRGTLRWVGGGDIDLLTLLPNPSDVKLQEPGDDARCVWLGVDDRLMCVGPTKIDRKLTVPGLHISGGSGDRLAVAGNAAVVVYSDNQVARIDLESGHLANDPDPPTVTPGAAKLAITASGNLVWLDDEAGNKAWVVHRFGINTIDKDDANAPLLDAQGQVKPDGEGGNGPGTGNGNAAGDDNAVHSDNNGHEDPPHAEPDSVTARAGATVTIPVTSNDWDPDDEPFAVSKVGADAGRSAASGTVDILDGNTVSYVPNLGFSGIDTFDYEIVDNAGQTDSATVTVELFPPGSPNRPPLARDDKAFTRVGQPITIDVLANDIDPERDTLSVAPFRQDDAHLSDTTGPTNLPALKYFPPDVPGIYPFTYQAVDPQGGTSEKATVTVTVSAEDAQNSPPFPNPDAIRLRVGIPSSLNVKANDTDADGDDLFISLPNAQPKGVSVKIVGQQLQLTLLPGAGDRLLVPYLLTDNHLTQPVTGSVLVLRIDDTAPNRPPVASPDADKVVIGNSVKIPVTANDLDPDKDVITLLSATDPVDGTGTTTVEGNSVRFTPNLPDIKEPTAVTFKYKISDGHSHDAIGSVTVTVLLEALPKPPSARDDFADTETNQPVTINVLANDTDPSGGGRPHLTTNPICAGGGDATRTPDDRVTFIPPHDITGTFSCKYSVSNDQGFRAEASIIVTVTDPPIGNRPPVITDAAMHPPVALGAQLTLNANALADDPDGDGLVFSAVGKPTHGQTDFTGKSSTFTYTAPSAGSADQTPDADNIEVTISDEKDGNVHGTITIKLVDETPTPPTTTPTPPLTHDISTVATVGVPLPFDVVAELRDANLPDTLTLVAASADSALGTAQVVNGVINIVPTTAGTLFVSYTVQNVAGGTKSDKIRVTITDPPQANPPVAVDDSLTVSSGGFGNVYLLDNDTGISDPDDQVSVTLNNRPPLSFGSIDLSNGVVSFVAAAGAEGSVILTYTLKDGSGLQSQAKLTIVVQPCSESPPQALDDSIFTPYQTPIDINLGIYILSGHLQPGSVRGAGLTGITGTYTPPAGMNGTEPVTFVVENGCHQTDLGQLTIDVNHSPLGGTIDRNMSGGDPPLSLSATDLASDDEPLSIIGLAGNPSWATFDPSTVTVAPPAGTPSGTYAFTATVQDPGGLTAGATVTVTISNTPPTAVADEYSTTESLLTFNPTQNDFDSESGQLCVQAISVVSPPETTIIPADPAPACTTFITVSLAHGVSTLNYTVRDSGGLTSSATITITSNNPPTIDPASAFTEGQPTVDVPLNITDLDGDSLRIVCNAPQDFIVVPRPTGSQADPTHPGWELDVTVSSTFNDPSPPSNSVQFTCTVRDDFSSATATMTVTQS